MAKQLILNFASTMARWLPESVKRGIYRTPFLAQFVRGALNRAAPAGWTEVEIAAGGAAGMVMQLDLQAEKDYWLGTYEADLQAAVDDLIEPGWTAYDAGANIGFVTLLLARKLGPSGKVFAFEALPDNVARLRAQVERNNLSSQVHVTAGAVTDSSEPVQFLIGPSGAMGKVAGSAGRAEGHSTAVTVPGLSLDDFIYVHGHPVPQVVKMDIEGGEVLALKGMTRLLSEAQPLILMELHGPEAARVAWETLTAAGYQIHQMTRGYPPVAALDELDWKAYLVGKAANTA